MTTPTNVAYQEDFDPKGYRQGHDASRPGQDLHDGSIYVYQDPIKLAVRVALATGRPLLMLGPPGSGKSSLAAFVARSMNWNYFEQVITSHTRAVDLLWHFDAVRRLRDAQANELHPRLEPYIDPRVLWWAFNPANARKRGAKRLPKNVPKALPPGELRGDDHPSVVLLDEIDKADPDVPNDLLVALGAQRFRVDDLGRDVVAVRPLLIFITSNNERSLPAAFLRRCVFHTLEHPVEQQLVEIAKAHFPDQAKAYAPTFAKVAERVVKMRGDTKDGSQAPPSTAEYLDAVRACMTFKVKPGNSDLWNAISTAVLSKRTPETTG